MTKTLTVTSRGQVTLRKELLRHLGIQPGEKIEIDLLPNGRAELRAQRRKHEWHELRGMLKNNGVHLTIEEINEAIAEAGAAAGAGEE